MIRRTALAATLAILLLPAIAVPAVTTAKAKTEAPVSSGTRQFGMQTTFADGVPLTMTIVASSGDEGRAGAAMASAAQRAQGLARELFGESGLEGKLANLPAGQPIELSPDAFAMIEKAVAIAAVTRGWYDIAGPSPGSWFTQRDWRRIDLDGAKRTIAFRSDRMQLDLRHIAQGYAVDLAMEAIAQAGFPDAKVEVGGVSRISGRDIFTPWTIEVGFGNDAAAKAQRAFAYNLTNVAAATVTGDGLGAGLIDPKSKKPVPGTMMRSLTALAADATTATAYALAAWTLGPRIGMRFIEEHPEVKGMLVDNGGRLFASQGLAGATGQPSDAAAMETEAIAAETTAETPPQQNLPAASAADRGPTDMKQKQLEEERDL